MLLISVWRKEGFISKENILLSCDAFVLQSLALNTNFSVHSENVLPGP
jgi:hypothetical protein